MKIVITLTIDTDIPHSESLAEITPHLIRALTEPDPEDPEYLTDNLIGALAAIAIEHAKTHDVLCLPYCDCVITK